MKVGSEHAVNRTRSIKKENGICFHADINQFLNPYSYDHPTFAILTLIRPQELNSPNNASSVLCGTGIHLMMVHLVG